MPKEQYEEWRKEPQPHCYSQEWMKNGGLVLWDAVAIFETSRTSRRNWKNSPWKTIRRTIQGTDHSICSNCRIPSDFNKRSIQTSPTWKVSFTWKYFQDTHWSRRWTWKGDILTADLEELEKMDASEIYPRRDKVKEILISQKEKEIKFPKTDGEAKLSGRERIPRTHSKAGTNRKEWRSQWRTSRRTERASTDRTTEKTFGRFKVTSSLVITLNLEFNFTCRNKKHSIFHLSKMTKKMSTQINLDVMKGKRIDDYWIVDENRSLSDTWTWFTNFTPIKEELWEGRYWPKDQTLQWAKCTGDLAPNRSTWKRKKVEVKVQEDEVEDGRDRGRVRREGRREIKHTSAWHMNEMTRTNTWASVVWDIITHARKPEKKVTCEVYCLHTPVGCSRLPSAVNDPATTIFFF